MRIILHVDMDCFFASIEERDRKIHGKPVVVGSLRKRGVVATANYIARKYGIKSGMPISIAKRKCKDCLFFPVRIKYYKKVSEEIMKILRKYADKFEKVSIDEAFLDISKRTKNFKEAKEIAIKIKEEIKRKEKLNCSIGISYNKLLAKVSSELAKPNGIEIMKKEDLKKKFWPLKVSKIWGIGPKTEKRMKKIGIKTIGELAKADPILLEENFGSLGAEFKRLANGIDESEVEEKREIKSIGREVTFESDKKGKELEKEMEKIAEDVWNKASKKFFFKGITIKIRYPNFETHTYSKTFESILNKREFLEECKKMTSKFEDRKIRLLGVRVFKLIKKGFEKIPNF